MVGEAAAAGGKMKKKKTVISQEAFDEVVKENIDDLGMDPGEALQDAIETLTLQGVDLSAIVTCSSSDPHPILCSLTQLKASQDQNELGPLLEDFILQIQGSDHDGGVSNAAAIATRNGGVEILTSKLSGSTNWEANKLGLKALCYLLGDVGSREVFERCGGPAVVIAILESCKSQSQQRGMMVMDVQNGCFAVIAAASTATEILKESFINLNVHQFILNALNDSYYDDGDGNGNGNVDVDLNASTAVYDAIRVLLTSDDNRVAASQVFGFARRFAKVGIADALVTSIQRSLAVASPSLISACLALKAVAVNDEICRNVADKGAIDVVLQSIDHTSSNHFNNNNTIALASCSLLSKLAGSDQNKSSIVDKRGMDRLIGLAARFEDDPSVIQEVMYIISILSLRLPDHASRAIEAGAGDLAIQAMQKFPDSQQLQRNACLMIRNLVVRNPENRKILLNNGIEEIIRKARETHKSCRAAATDALRDLGLANYNL